MFKISASPASPSQLSYMMSTLTIGAVHK